MIITVLTTLLFQSTSAFFHFATTRSNIYNHNSNLPNKFGESLPSAIPQPLQKMSAHRQRTQEPSLTKPADGAKDHDTTEAIAIVGVTCSTLLDKSPHLQSGVAELFKLYFEELYDLGCDLGFQGFQTEWADLPGKYDFAKRGGLFVAVAVNVELPPVAAVRADEARSGEMASGDGDGAVGGGVLFVPPGCDLPEACGTTLEGSLTSALQVVGCIALRPLTETCGEVKRMYIRKSHRRRGVGKFLAEAIVEQAWGDQCKFEEIKLDSLERLVGAVKLYENMGFQRIEPYCDCPEDDHICMNLFK